MSDDTKIVQALLGTLHTFNGEDEWMSRAPEFFIAVRDARQAGHKVRIGTLLLTYPDGSTAILASEGDAP